MKRLKWLIPALFIAGFATALYSSTTREAAYQAARGYLDSRGEVYFTFHVKSKAELYNYTRIVSIDNIIGDSVLAYANSAEFQKFYSTNTLFEVLLPPGLQPVDIKMLGVDQVRRGEYREWDSYPTYEAYVAMMNKFAKDYPDLCKIEEMGSSIKGRKILAAKVSDNVAQDEKETSVFYQATIHGDEVCGYVLMLRLIDYLCKNYATDDRVKKIVNNMEIYINPDANPDGTYKGGNSSVNGSQRGNSNNVDMNRAFPSPSGHSQNSLQPENTVYMDFTKKIKPVLSADFHGGAELICYVWGCWSKRHPDDAWWKYVCKEWADVVHANCSPGYFTDPNGGTGIINAYDWYEVHGERMNWEIWANQCRDVTVEIGTQKIETASVLPTRWNNQYRSFLNYIEQAMYGIQGTVTDSIKGTPLAAKIFVEKLDADSSHVYSLLPHGDFYRPINEGTYSLTVTAVDPTTKKANPEYVVKKIDNVKVVNKQATVLDIKIRPVNVGTAAAPAASAIVPFSVVRTLRGVVVYGCEPGTAVAVYDAAGTLVKALQSTASGTLWDGKDLRGNLAAAGCYIVKAGGSRPVSRSFVYAR